MSHFVTKNKQTGKKKQISMRAVFKNGSITTGISLPSGCNSTRVKDREGHLAELQTPPICIKGLQISRLPLLKASRCRTWMTAASDDLTNDSKPHWLQASRHWTPNSKLALALRKVKLCLIFDNKLKSHLWWGLGTELLGTVLFWHQPKKLWSYWVLNYAWSFGAKFWYQKD